MTQQASDVQANQSSSAPKMPYKAFGEAIKLARKKIEENPAIVDNLGALTVYIEFELDQRFELSVGQLAKVPAAIKIAQQEIEKVAYSEWQISLQTPGLTFPSGSSFPSGSIIFTDGSAISDAIIKEARELVCDKRQAEFKKFLQDKKAFAAHVRSLIEEQYPGDKWIDKEKFLAAELLYEGRVISRGKDRESAIRNIVEQVIRERRIVKGRVNLENEWRRKAVAHVTQLAVAEIRNSNKEFSKSALFKKLAKAEFEGKPLPKDVVDEGIKRGQDVCRIDNGTFQRLVVIKKAAN